MSRLSLLCLFFASLLFIGTVCSEDEFEKEVDVNDNVVVENSKPTGDFVKYVDPQPDGLGKDLYFQEQFPNKQSFDRWILSKSTKPEAGEELSQYNGEWGVEIPSNSIFQDDYSLVLKSKARHHAISINLDRPFDFEKTSQFVMQYEVKFSNTPECSGAYVKLISYDPLFKPVDFNDKTNYSIMFGPDKCGLNHKCHFIVRLANPISGVVTEHHSKKASDVGQNIFNDLQTHVYRLELSGNNYRVLIDNSVSDSGNMLKDLDPPIVPPKMIDDPNDFKPQDWDDREMIPNDAAVKPDDWDEEAPMEIVDVSKIKPVHWLDDEPLLIADSEAVMPDDYDEEIDGKWAAPMIDNPKCLMDGEGICGEWEQPMKPNPEFKGKWIRPQMKNPAYKGIWKSQSISNPDFFEFEGLVYPKISSIGAIGLELWSMTDGIYFDNFAVASSLVFPNKLVNQIWKEKSRKETPKSSGKFEYFMNRAAKQPILYATCIVAVFIVIVTLIAWANRRSQRRSVVGEDKKSDAITEDDVVQNGGKSDNQEEDEEIKSNDEDEHITKRRVKRNSTRKSEAESSESRNSEDDE